MEAARAVTWVMAEDAIVVDMDEESIALSMGAGRYFGVRGAMRHLMPDLRAGATREAMIARLCAHYDVTPEMAGADIDRMLPRLIEAQLVRQIDPA